MIELLVVGSVKFTTILLVWLFLLSFAFVVEELIYALLFDYLV